MSRRPAPWWSYVVNGAVLGVSVTLLLMSDSDLARTTSLIAAACAAASLALARVAVARSTP